jgi:uncharacterized protein YecE (DUF72 family)
MEFGRVPSHQLDSINFNLSAEPDSNAVILHGGSSPHSQVFIGCNMWVRKEWEGKIYPPKTSPKNYLNLYVNSYNCIELNATFYKIYDPVAIANWAKTAQHKNFKFCPKMVKDISHNINLGLTDHLVELFLSSVSAFDKTLGPVFIQFADNFSPNRMQELFSFLEKLPTHYQFFIELRHAEWFLNARLFKKVVQRLTELNIGLITTDTAGRRECAHMHLTVPKAFIRFVGNGLHTTDYTRMDAWVQRIKYWLDSGLQELYFFIHTPDEETVPELSAYVIKKLNEVTGIAVAPPIFVKAPNTLF